MGAEAIAMDAPLTQESELEVGEREVLIRTRILLEPELLVVTEVLSGDAVLQKQHSPVTAATADDVQSRGQAALQALLQSSHLRTIQRLLASANAPAASLQAPPVGVLATMVFGEKGEVLWSAGEEAIPSSWLRAAYMVSGIANLVVAKAPELGRFTGALIHNPELQATFHGTEKRITACFVDRDHGASADSPTVIKHLEDAACSLKG